ncbi:hypothetical protein D3C72_1981340 [compost metagenome]
MHCFSNLIHVLCADCAVLMILLQPVNPDGQQKQRLRHPVMQLLRQPLPGLHCRGSRPLLLQLQLIALHNPEQRQQQNNAKHKYKHRR